MNDGSCAKIQTLDVEAVMGLIPHRYPFLLVDKVQDIVQGACATGIKNVTINEPYFMGHFPEKPVMPGVLIIEAMAQTSAILVMHTLSISHIDHLVYFMSIDNARFRKVVKPGDCMQLRVEKIHHRGKVWKFSGKAFVQDDIVAEACYTAMISPRSA